jgi:hypothetical protein
VGGGEGKEGEGEACQGGGDAVERRAEPRRKPGRSCAGTMPSTESIAATTTAAAATGMSSAPVEQTGSSRVPSEGGVERRRALAPDEPFSHIG